MRPIARAIGRFWNHGDSRARRGLVMTYPHYLYLRDQLDPDVTLYYNIDDYALYWPRHADEVRCLERQMVLQCRRDGLRRAVSGRRAPRGRSGSGGEDPSYPPRHAAAFLADEPPTDPLRPPADIAHLPRPLLGYVGSIGPRVDWRLMERLSEAFPQASIVVVGEEPHSAAIANPGSGTGRPNSPCSPTCTRSAGGRRRTCLGITKHST